MVTRTIDREIAALAGIQHGVVALWQLVSIGLSAAAVRKRCAAGRLHRLHVGVYAVGHRSLPPRAPWMAAVLACGRDAVLSHRSAAALHGLIPPPGGPVDVTVPPGCRRRRPSLRVHRAASGPGDTTVLDHIPVTSVPRTISDLAAVLDRPRLDRLLEHAERLGIADVRPTPGRRGAARLRAALLQQDPLAPYLRSELERRTLALCRRRGLAIPQVDVPIRLPDGTTIIADFLWPAPRVVLEADGRTTHGTRLAGERDRRRDQLLTAAGYRPLRTTWHQVTREPDTLVATLATVLAQYSADASRRR